MANEFNVKLEGFNDLNRFLNLGPEETRKATSHFLNEMAFKGRAEGPKTLKDIGMTIRNPGFVQSRFYVEKANPSTNPSSQVSKVGSTKSDRFSGWAEAYGEEPERNRLLGPTARGGDMKAKALPSNRLMPKTTFESPDNFDEIPERMRIPAMLSILARNPDYTAEGKGAFIIDGDNKWVPGLYKFKRGQQARWQRSKKKGLHLSRRDRATYERPQVTRIQTFGESPTKNSESMKKHWMQILTDRLISEWAPRIAFEALQKYLTNKK